MKKILLVLLLLVMVFGCAKISEDNLAETVEIDDPQDSEQTNIEIEETIENTEQTEEKIEQTQEVKDTDETTIEETTENNENEVVEKDEEIIEEEKTGELKELLDKIENKIKNFRYNYGEPPFNTEINYYSVQLKNSKGEKEVLIRIDLYEYEPPKVEDYWDTVFLNPAIKEAKIYCLDNTKCQSKEVIKTNVTEIVEYAEYIVKTPYDWAKLIPNNAKRIGTETLDKREVTKFEFTGTDGLFYTVWIDNTYGLPQKVTVVSPDDIEVRYIFKDMTIDTEDDEDFKPPF